MDKFNVTIAALQSWTLKCSIVGRARRHEFDLFLMKHTPMLDQTSLLLQAILLLFQTVQNRPPQPSSNLAGGTAILASDKLLTTQIFPVARTFVSLEITLVVTEMQSSIIYLASVYCPNQTLHTNDFSNIFYLGASHPRPYNNS